MSRFKALGFGLIAFSFPVLAGIGLLSLVNQAGFSWGKVWTEMGSNEMAFTLKLTLVYSILGLVLSWVSAWLLVMGLRGRGSALFRVLSVLPSLSYALGVIWVLKFFRVIEIYSMRSVLMAWVFAGTVYLAGGLSEGVRDLDPRNAEALRVLGAGKIRSWWHHEFRGTGNLQSALLLQQLWFYLTSFSLVLILNGGPPHETLEVGVYASLRMGEMNLSRAVAFAFVQGVILIVLRILISRLPPVRTSQGEWGRMSEARRRPRTSQMLWFGVGALALLIFGVFGFNGIQVFDFAGPILVSLHLSAWVVLSTALFSICCWAAGLPGLASFGTWFSPILLSLAIWNLLAYRTPTLLNVICIQTLLFAPWFSRGVFPALARKRIGESEAVRVFGANPRQVFWWVEWPRVRGAVVKSAALVFSLSITEVSTVMLFSRGDWDTLGSFTQNLFSRFRIEEAAFGVFVMMAFLVSGILVSEVLS